MRDRFGIKSSKCLYFVTFEGSLTGCITLDCELSLPGPTNIVSLTSDFYCWYFSRLCPRVFLFFFPLLTVLFLRKLSFIIQSFCGKLEERKMRRTGLSLLRYLLWLGTMFCFVLFPNYASVPQDSSGPSSSQGKHYFWVCLPLLLHLFTFFPNFEISLLFTPVKHGFWR